MRDDDWRIHEVNGIHRRWELINELTHVLDVATCPEERKMLALLLEDKRLRVWWNTDGQYERIYRPAVKDLHDKYYHYCWELAEKIEVGRVGDEPPSSEES
jgi:hypothetical protein